MKRARVGVSVASVVLAVVFAVEPAAAFAATKASLSGGVRVSSSFALRAILVSAKGSVSVPGGVSDRHWRVVLQQSVKGARGRLHWAARASAPLARGARRVAYQLAWTAPVDASSLAVRVAVLSGRTVLAHGTVKRLTVTAPVRVSAVLARGSIEPAAGQVLGVGGAPAGAGTVTLAHGATVPAVGGGLIVPVSPGAPHGLFAVVTGLNAALTARRC